jgi:hypothetical protein
VNQIISASVILSLNVLIRTFSDEISEADYLGISTFSDEISEAEII